MWNLHNWDTQLLHFLVCIKGGQTVQTNSVPEKNGNPTRRPVAIL